MLHASGGRSSERTVDMQSAPLTNLADWFLFPLALSASDNAWLVCWTNGHWEAVTSRQSKLAMFPLSSHWAIQERTDTLSPEA